MARSRRVVLGLCRLLLRLFFRAIEVTGREHVPAGACGIVVSWHPNGILDPALILAHFPGRVSFGARHGLFRWPLLGALMRAAGTVPIHRAIDPDAGDVAERRAANRRSLEELARSIAEGAFASLFPEGVSHDSPHPVELKTGAARLYYQARGMRPADAPPPVIVPVGLHYSRKELFRSRALVAIHPPIELPPELDVHPAADEPAESARQRNRDLTRLIERTLHEVVHATEDWETHHLMHRARKIVRAEQAHRAGVDPGKPAMHERQLGFARVWAGYRERVTSHPAEIERLRLRVASYEADLRALDIEDHDLDRDPRWGSPWLGAALVGQLLAVYLLLPPLLLFGYAINLPVALVLLGLSKWAATAGKDEASLKLMIGTVLFPLSWIGAGVLAAWAHARLHAAFPVIPDTPVLAAVATVVLGAVGGAVALRYGRIARETLRAVRVRLRRRTHGHAILRLRLERSTLYDGIRALADGLELPGD